MYAERRRAPSAAFPHLVPLLVQQQALELPPKAMTHTRIQPHQHPAHHGSPAQGLEFRVYRPGRVLASLCVIGLGTDSISNHMTLDKSAPTASSSSMNTTHGAFLRASANRSRMRAAPRPTNSSTNSEALAAKKGTPASPATALAANAQRIPHRSTLARASADDTAQQTREALTAKEGAPGSACYRLWMHSRRV